MFSMEHGSDVTGEPIRRFCRPERPVHTRLSESRTGQRSEAAGAAH